MFKQFCFDLKKEYPNDYRCDWIEDALDDEHFPWTGDYYDMNEYLDDAEACYEAINCLTEVWDEYKK